MTINNDTLSSDVWTAIKNRVVSALSTESITASVESSYNDKKLTKPLVVIDPVNINENSYYLNDNEGDKKIPVVVTVYSKTGLTMDTVADALIKHFKMDDVVGLAFTGYDTDNDFNYDYKNPQWAKTITLNYYRL